MNQISSVNNSTFPIDSSVSDEVSQEDLVLSKLSKGFFDEAEILIGDDESLCFRSVIRASEQGCFDLVEGLLQNQSRRMEIIWNCLLQEHFDIANKLFKGSRKDFRIPMILCAGGQGCFDIAEKLVKELEELPGGNNAIRKHAILAAAKYDLFDLAEHLLTGHESLRKKMLLDAGELGKFDLVEKFVESYEKKFPEEKTLRITMIKTALKYELFEQAERFLKGDHEVLRRCIVLDYVKQNRFDPAAKLIESYEKKFPEEKDFVLRRNAIFMAYTCELFDQANKLIADNENLRINLIFNLALEGRLADVEALLIDHENFRGSVIINLLMHDGVCTETTKALLMGHQSLLEPIIQVLYQEKREETVLSLLSLF